MDFSRFFVAALALGSVPASAAAQDRDSDIEQGATRPSRVEMRAGVDSDRADDEAAFDELRIGLQARLDTALTFAGSGLDAPGVPAARALLVPIAAPGARWLEGKLFTGLGIGLVGVSGQQGAGTASRSGFSLSPLATYDLHSDESMALSLGGWLNFARLGETEACNADGENCVEANDDITAVGLSVAGGIRGWLSRGLTLGAELGWGFMDLSQDDGNGGFIHGLFGAIVLEATIEP
jgi:hypothetical protein